MGVLVQRVSQRVCIRFHGSRGREDGGALRGRLTWRQRWSCSGSVRAALLHAVPSVFGTAVSKRICKAVVWWRYGQVYVITVWPGSYDNCNKQWNDIRNILGPCTQTSARCVAPSGWIRSGDSPLTQCCTSAEQSSHAVPVPGAVSAATGHQWWWKVSPEGSCGQTSARAPSQGSPSLSCVGSNVHLGVWSQTLDVTGTF